MKAQELLSLLASGLEAAAHAHTASNLGDRRTYLGMSDLARGLTCPRAVVARKLNGEPTSLSLETLLQLRRGHWLEYGVEEALTAAGQKFISQLEISIEHNGVPIKAHLDLLIFDEEAKAVTVIELKSVGRLRDHVYGSHEAQLYGQLGLLHRYWSQAVFANNVFVKGSSLPACSEYCSFSELASRQLGVQLPKDADSVSIHGFVLTVAPQSAKAFGPYAPNDEVLKVLFQTGAGLWSHMEEIRSGRADLGQVAYQQGFDPLCDWCGHNRDCPKFQGDSHPALEPELSALADLKAARSRLEEEIKEREEQLKAIAAIMGKSGQWISGNRYRFKVSRMPGRATIDQHLLKSSLGQLKQVDENQLDSLLSSAQKISRPFERLQLSPIH
ncbi:hypothetical protein C4J81_15975 [Deltaproteobacteria bacterium Smac51]|nr:hypothetical protein C4J81_15975 [Deltaproteobacteria bacterium Smac51]